MVPIPVRKHLALMVYLAVEPRIPHPRERLVTLLWPRANESEGRHSLATALSFLRRAIGSDCFEADRDRVRLTNVLIHLDLLDLNSEERTRNGPPIMPRPFLDGFDVGDAPDFDLWIDSQRLRWTPLISRTLSEQIAAARARGEVQELEQLSDQLMTLDPLNEDAVWGKMEARALVGDRIAALRTFNRWRRQLSSELGAYPSRRISDLADKLREGISGPETHSDSRPPAQAPTTCEPLLGRPGEFEALYAHWLKALSGAPCVAVVLGPEGYGKSSLLRWFSDAAAINGGAVCRTGIHDLDRSVPAAVLAEVVRFIVQLPGAVGAAPESLARLGSVSPYTRTLFPGAAGTRGERYSPVELAEALVDLMSAVAAEQPLLLVLDDADNADEFSLIVLHLAMRKAGGQPIMLAAAASDPFPANRRALSSILASQVGVTGGAIRLGPLNDELIGAIIDRASPDLRSDRVVKPAIVKASQGNPGHAIEFVRDWWKNGRSCSALMLSAMVMPHSSRPQQHGSQGMAGDHLLRGLGAKTRRVGQAAAVLDRHLEDLSAYLRLGLSFEDVSAAMEELQRRGLIHEFDGRLRFSNSVCRVRLYLACPKPTREMLHRLVAERLISAYNVSESPASGLEIAWHLLRSGNPGLASRYLIPGVRAALNAGASADAETALATALDWLPPDARAECTLLLAELMQEQGRWGESIQVLSSVDWNGIPNADALLTLAQERLLPPDSGRTRGTVKRMLTLIGQAADAVELTRLAWTAATLANDLRDPQAAAEVLAHLEQVPPDRLHRERLGQFALASALMLYQTRDRQRSYRQVESMVAQLDHASTANTTISKLHAGLGAILCGQGAYEQAIPHLEKAYAISRRAENLWAAGAHAANIALCLARLGKHADQLRWARVAKTDLGDSTPAYVDVQASYCEGLALANLGERAAAREAIDRPRFGSGRDLPRWADQAWGFFRADVLYLLGERRAAVAAAHYTLRSDDYTLLSDAFAGPYARWLARTSRPGPQAQAAAARLEELALGASRLDALDQAELACARLELARRVGTPPAEGARGALDEALRALPAAVARHLAELGFLPRRQG